MTGTESKTAPEGAIFDGFGVKSGYCPIPVGILCYLINSKLHPCEAGARNFEHLTGHHGQKKTGWLQRQCVAFPLCQLGAEAGLVYCAPDGHGYCLLFVEVQKETERPHEGVSWAPAGAEERIAPLNSSRSENAHKYGFAA